MLQLFSRAFLQPPMYSPAVPVSGAVRPETERTLELPREPEADGGHTLRPGVTVGRFRLGRAIGEGGMGVVYEAQDADLGRTVAIKVMRSGAGDAASERLLREAQAMARLSHPNVVVVHEVGSVGDRVFLAMERVRGVTLGAWLSAAPRSWQAIVAVLVQAGDGLAAAHAVGLIHRDFKPDNLLVDELGRARVSDFGISLVGCADLHRADASAQDRAAITQTGALVGTPAYMAPEQQRGGAIDARADQYAFAITLHEALLGYRPGEPGPPSAPRAVPAAVRRLLARALATEPADRFTGMEPLVARLRRALDRIGRLTLGLVGAVLVASAGTVGLLAGRSPGADPCIDGAALVDDLWNAGARRALTERFFASGRPHASATTRVTLSLVDEWAGGWRLARRAACGTDAVRSQDRVACLDRQLVEFRADLAVWRVADAAVVDRAVTAAHDLPDLALCSTRGHGGATTLASAALVERTARVNAQVHTGQLQPARAELPALIAEVEATRDPALLASLLLSAAAVERELGDLDASRQHAERAVQAAADADDDRTLVRALLAKSMAMVDQGHADDAIGIVDAAEALRRRADLGDLDVEVMTQRGRALAHAGHSGAAIDELERALALAEQRPATSGAVLFTLGQLGVARLGGEDYTGALAAYTRVLAEEEATLGPTHPEVGRTLHDIAVCEGQLGRTDEARNHLERARNIEVTAGGPRNPLVAAIEVGLGDLDRDHGDRAAARGHYRAALDLLSSPTGSGHLEVPTIETSLGMLDRDAERCADALPHFSRALALYERAGNTGIGPTNTRLNLGMCLLAVGRGDEARPVLERTLAELEALKVKVSTSAEPLIGLAEAAAAKGRRGEALKLGRRALAATIGDTSPNGVGFRAFVSRRVAAWERGLP